MKIIFLLIAVSLVLALGFLISFFWAVRNGQYEDDYTPSVRILFDEKNCQPTDNQSIASERTGLEKPILKT